MTRPKQFKFDADGDLAYQTAAGKAATLPLGATGQVLTVVDAVSGVLGWAPPPTAGAGTTFVCLATLAVTDVVYLSSANFVSVASTAAGAGQTPDAIGVVLSKPTTTTAVVTFSGVVPGFFGLTPGIFYYQDPATPGGVTASVPAGPGQKVQRVGVATSPTELLVAIERTVALA